MNDLSGARRPPWVKPTLVRKRLSETLTLQDRAIDRMLHRDVIQS